ncbi:hypothetical protein PMAYCL1PPCAC_25282, partial [Pristionchus mayeri]
LLLASFSAIAIPLPNAGSQIDGSPINPLNEIVKGIKEITALLSVFLRNCLSFATIEIIPDSRAVRETTDAMLETKNCVSLQKSMTVFDSKSPRTLRFPMQLTGEKRE